MKIAHIFLRIAALFSFILFILLLNFRFYVYNLDFYEHEFQKLGVYDTIDRDIALVQTKNLFNFFKTGEFSDVTYFNEKEMLHLRDVYVLIHRTIFLFYVVSAVLFFLFFMFRRLLAKVFIVGGASLFILVILLSLPDFGLLFVFFHKIAFANELWLLNPETDNLINLFPVQFFYDFVKKIFFNSGIIGLLFVCWGFFLRRRE